MFLPWLFVIENLTHIQIQVPKVVGKSVELL
jgi:hypothetical protein